MDETSRKPASPPQRPSTVRILTEGYTVQSETQLALDGFQPSKTTPKPPPPTTGSGVKPPKK